MSLPPVMFNFNKFRNSEVLNEEVLDNQGAQELARKLIQTYASDNAKTNAIQPSDSDQISLDRYLTGFLNSVVYEYGGIYSGVGFNPEELITRWNALTTFFVNEINPLYAYYVIDKISPEIVERIKEMRDWNVTNGDEGGNLRYGLNQTALDLLFRYAQNGVLRPIPYSLIYSRDGVSDERRVRVNQYELEQRDDYVPPGAPGAPAVPVLGGPLGAPAPVPFGPARRRGRPPGRRAAVVPVIPAAGLAAVAALPVAALRRALPIIPAAVVRRALPVRPVRPAVVPVVPAAAPIIATPVASPAVSPAVSRAGSPDLGLAAMGIGLGKPRKGRGKNTTTKFAKKDAALGVTPSGYTTSQSYPSRLSQKTVQASYAGKGKPLPFVVF